MLSIDPKQQTARENYKLLIGSIIPRPIAFVTSIAKDGTLNGAPFSFFNVVSSHPPMVSIAIQRKNGKRKDTARNIIEHKSFVVHIVDEQNVAQINETAASLAANESEIKHTGLTPVPSQVISVPGIQEAKIRFECTLEQSIELAGDDALIIGRIVRYHVDKSIYDDGKINYKALEAVSRLAGSDYSKVGDVFSIERPK